MYPEFPEITIKAIPKERNSQRILNNLTMTYFKNSGFLDSQAAAKTFMTALGGSQKGDTSTRTEIKRRTRGKEALASDGFPK